MATKKDVKLVDEGTTGERRGRGRPPKTDEARQVTLMLTTPLDDQLTDLTHSIWQSSRTRISKSELVRASLRAVLESGIDLTVATNEDEIAQLLLKKLRR